MIYLLLHIVIVLAMAGLCRHIFREFMATEIIGAPPLPKTQKQTDEAVLLFIINPLKIRY
jgi:hypothetical protein